MNISDRIFQLLKERGDSIEEFGKNVGIPTQEIYDWKDGKDIPKADMIALIASYFNTTTDYILTGKEHKNDNKVLFSVATCFSIIGIVILFIDMFLTWNIEQNFMDNYMKAAKIIYALCICISIILFFISNERTNNERVRKFWIINIWAYAGIIPVLVYLFIVPGIFWALCSYVVTVFVGEMVLLIIKKNK